MPRRHRRVEELLTPVDPDATLGPRHRYRLERDRAQREAVEKVTRCVWPECNGSITYVNGKRTPLCLPHVVDLTWEAQHAYETRKPLTEYQLNRELEARNREHAQARAAASRSIAPGWIYYVRVTDRIKIGYSSDVRQRMRAYPPHAELLAVHPGTQQLEREIHKDLAGHLAQGREWFRPGAPVMAHIDRVLTEFGKPPAEFHYKFRDSTPTGQVTQLRSRTRRRSRRSPR